MKKNKQQIWAAAVIILALIVLAASIVYLLTGKMVPGLIPLSSALLMLPMLMLWGRKQENGKLYAILFLSASILNLIAGILQIMQAI